MCHQANVPSSQRTYTTPATRPLAPYPLSVDSSDSSSCESLCCVGNPRCRQHNIHDRPWSASQAPNECPLGALSSPGVEHRSQGVAQIGAVTRIGNSTRTVEQSRLVVPLRLETVTQPPGPFIRPRQPRMGCVPSHQLQHWAEDNIHSLSDLHALHRYLERPLGELRAIQRSSNFTLVGSAVALLQGYQIREGITATRLLDRIDDFPIYLARYRIAQQQHREGTNQPINYDEPYYFY